MLSDDHKSFSLVDTSELDYASSIGQNQDSDYHSDAMTVGLD